MVPDRAPIDRAAVERLRTVLEERLEFLDDEPVFLRTDRLRQRELD